MNPLPTDRTRVRRRPERGVYEPEQIYSILDEGYICHVGFVESGQPYVIPTTYGRAGNLIYLHGSAVSRMLTSLAQAVPMCVTVTLVDGLVLARSAFHHSINYRSVVILGRARPLTDLAEKKEALHCITNHIVPGRWEEVRQPDEEEMAITQVLALSLDEASAKVRTGPPVDADGDYALPVWAGVVPLRTQPEEPVPDERLVPGVAALDTGRFARFFKRGRKPV